MKSMLLRSGEVGFGSTSEEDVYERCGVSRDRFYKHFTDKTHCFAAAYTWKAGQLTAELVEVIEREGSTEERITRTLEAVASFLGRNTALTRSLIVEVHSAGDGALAKRRRIMARIAQAIEGVWPGTAAPHSQVATKAEFLVSAIDQALSIAIEFGSASKFAQAVPQLATQIIPYVGPLDPAENRVWRRNLP